MAKIRGKPFEPGNKLGRGRPRGIRNKARNQAQLLLEQNAESIMRACQIHALKGNSKALELCVERIIPRRDSAVQIRLGPTHTASELATASQRVVRGIGSGKITPAEGEKIINVLENRRKVIETIELESRVSKLEEAQESSEAGSRSSEKKR